MHSTLKWKYTKREREREREKFPGVSYIHILFHFLDVKSHRERSKDEEARPGTSGRRPGHGTNYYDTLRQQQHLCSGMCFMEYEAIEEKCVENERKNALRSTALVSETRTGE